MSSYPSMGAGVSLRIRPFTRAPIPSENFFAFRENPFSLTPNPRFLHRTRQAHETLTRLTRGILERRGLLVLCGPVGTGKTTLLYSALHLMDVSPAVQNKIGTAMIVHPTLSRDEFMEAVLDEFDVECASTRRDLRLEALLNMLLEVRRRGGVAVLVIDEAQMLSPDVLEEVKVLLSLQTSHERLVQIVLCGHPELEGKLTGLSLPHGEPFVAVRCSTYALSLRDTHDYVQHRLRIAGARTDSLFMPEALDAIHLHTGGIPRLINLLCGQALSVASGYQAGRVFPYMVDEAAGQICSGALPPPSSGTLLRILPMRCDGDGAEADICEGVPAGEREATKIEHVEPALAEAAVSAGPEPGNEDLADAVDLTVEPAVSVDEVVADAVEAVDRPAQDRPAEDDPAEGASSAAALGDPAPANSDSAAGSSLPARSTAVSSGHERSLGADALATKAARKKRRALRHRAKFAQAAKRAQAGARPSAKCDFAENPTPSEQRFRQSGFRPSPFRRGEVRTSRLRLADFREFGQLSAVDLAGSLPAWNQWLNHWCSEHFTSKSCGKPLFQLGLAGTLFLALAQAMAAGFPRQHLAHVAFGFLGMLFIDISLGLGTYLLLIERRLTPASRGWPQMRRRRLG